MKAFLTTVLIAITVFSSAPSGARAETITLVADTWCPYNCEPGSEKPGYMVELADKAFARHGIKVEYKVMPWARAIEDTRHGKYSGIIGAYYSDAPDFIYPEVSQGTCQFAFYVRANDAWIYTGMASLPGRSLGVINDYSYSQELDAYIKAQSGNEKSIQVASGDNALEINIRKLLASRIDSFIEDRQAVSYTLSQSTDLKETDLKEAGILPDESDDNGAIFIAFSPNHPNSEKYAKILADETESMRKNGEMTEILSRYGISSLERVSP